MAQTVRAAADVDDVNRRTEWTRSDSRGPHVSAGQRLDPTRPHPYGPVRFPPPPLFCVRDRVGQGDIFAATPLAGTPTSRSTPSRQPAGSRTRSAGRCAPGPGHPRSRSDEARPYRCRVEGRPNRGLRAAPPSKSGGDVSTRRWPGSLPAGPSRRPSTTRRRRRPQHRSPLRRRRGRLLRWTRVQDCAEPFKLQ